MNTFFQRQVLSRLWATFVALGLGLVIFGACTLNLGLLLMANLELLRGYGWQAVMDGALGQLVELVVTGLCGARRLCGVQELRTSIDRLALARTLSCG